jgi:hypothetical protein
VVAGFASAGGQPCSAQHSEVVRCGLLRHAEFIRHRSDLVGLVADDLHDGSTIPVGQYAQGQVEVDRGFSSHFGPS